MISNRFALFMMIRVALLTIVLFVLGLAINASGYYALSLILGGSSIMLSMELYRYLNRTNVELTRFLDAVRYEDFGQNFQSLKLSASNSGANFENLAQAFNDIMLDFKTSRQKQEEKLRHLKSLTEHLPTPLLSLYADGRIQLHNNAARRLFGAVNITRVEDLRAFGIELAEVIAALEPGARRLVNFSYDGMQRQLTVVMTSIQTHSEAGTLSEKLISLQDIQSELDGVQLRAWQDLVRVLTHEIMNSITPVASLAKTACDLVDDARLKLQKNASADSVKDELEDVRSAVTTVARRSDGLMQFVQSYRSLTLLPAPKKQRLLLLELFQRVDKLLATDWAQKGIALVIKVETEGLELNADPGLLEQVLINLLNNAEQALSTSNNPCITNPCVTLRARLNQLGYVLIEVIDNGPGIPARIASEIFVPFFTTKRDGSGVGLALTRQIMIAHGGSVSVANVSDSVASVSGPVISESAPGASVSTPREVQDCHKTGAKFTLIF